MALIRPVEDDSSAPADARAVFDDIKAVRRVERVNNFWRYLAAHPPTMRRIWEAVKQVMAPGNLDPLTKEMLYIAVSVTNNCEYCVHSHTAAARKAGMTEGQLHELMAVVGLANETNRLANGYRIPVDAQFQEPPQA